MNSVNSFEWKSYRRELKLKKIEREIEWKREREGGKVGRDTKEEKK